MALCDDLKTLEHELESSIERAADLETIVRLNAKLVMTVNKRAIRNAALLERICDHLKIDYSDLDLKK